MADDNKIKKFAIIIKRSWLVGPMSQEYRLTKEQDEAVMRASPRRVGAIYSDANWPSVIN